MVILLRYSYQILNLNNYAMVLLHQNWPHHSIDHIVREELIFYSYLDGTTGTGVYI